MASPNMNLRDPVLYRILHTSHPMWEMPGASTRCMTLPMASPMPSRGITHSICTLEFESHRPLYEWFLDNLPVPANRAYGSFAGLNLPTR